MDLLGNVLYGFSVALQPTNLLFAFLGVFIGTAVGVLPGLGASGAIALLLPVTFAMDPVVAVIMVAGIYYGTMYGGSTTSILLNIPGEAASVVTAIDGYQMAKKGRAGPALGMCAFASFIAGTIGLVPLTFLAPLERAVDESGEQRLGHVECRPCSGLRGQKTRRRSYANSVLDDMIAKRSGSARPLRAG